ncbi:MAG: MFS transporter [Candidatus Obscuribacterales bacterium]|nr:MFS transporter [Candidatus Obscuribacterales bacterium]
MEETVHAFETTETAPKGEILSWAMYDFANSSYATIVATAIFNPYFVSVVAGNGSGLKPGDGTLWLTISICLSSLAVVISAPVIGTIADAHACKKRILLVATTICIACTVGLYWIHKGDYVLGLIFLTIANFAYGTGEDLVAAFLPELAARKDMGRVSAFGWTVGYLGGISTLGLCLLYVDMAKKAGQTAEMFVPVTMLITAAFYATGAAPIFLFLKERAVPDPLAKSKELLKNSFDRLKQTMEHARHYQDLFRFLISLLVFTCGTSTVISLASVYAQEVMGFTTKDCLLLIFVVNITAAVGAFSMGFVQDKIGSVRTLTISLILWIIATSGAYFCTTKELFWALSNLIGIAMGASGSCGRALVGSFSPPGRSGEFFGLWGLAGKLATAIGPLTYGFITAATHNNHRMALLSSTSFFVIGLLLLLLVNEKRGKEAAHERLDQVEK